MISYNVLGAPRTSAARRLAWFLRRRGPLSW